MSCCPFELLIIVTKFHLARTEAPHHITSPQAPSGPSFLSRTSPCHLFAHRNHYLGNTTATSYLSPSSTLPPFLLLSFFFSRSHPSGWVGAVSVVYTWSYCALRYFTLHYFSIRSLPLSLPPSLLACAIMEREDRRPGEKSFKSSNFSLIHWPGIKTDRRL